MTRDFLQISSLYHPRYLSRSPYARPVCVRVDEGGSPRFSNRQARAIDGDTRDRRSIDRAGRSPRRVTNPANHGSVIDIGAPEVGIESIRSAPPRACRRPGRFIMLISRSQLSSSSLFLCPFPSSPFIPAFAPRLSCPVRERGRAMRKAGTDRGIEFRLMRVTAREVYYGLQSSGIGLDCFLIEKMWRWKSGDK